MWVIYSRKDDKPLWKSSDRESLSRLLAELNKAFNEKFYMDEIKEKK
jgi:hypothetical protein